MKDSPISESSNTKTHEESKSQRPQKTATKKDRVSKEAQNLTSSVDEQQLNASPSESHATIIQPPSIERSPYVVTENSVSTSVHANQPRSLSASENLPPVTSSKNQQLSNFSPNAIFSSSISSSENQSTNMPFLEESSSSILKELHRLLCDPTRPLIIDDESLIDLKHVIIGDYNVHKEAAPHLSLYYPNNPITFLKCQKLHSYIKNGGTPLRFFLLEPSIDRVQTIFANGFSIFQHDILNKLALNPTVKIENDQCLGEVYQYITWWKGQMMNFGHVICSNYMISGIQQIPIRSFLSPVVCYPFSPTFKKIEFSFSKFNHRISCPFILSGTNIKVKSLFVIFVGQYGNLFPGSNIEVQPTRFNRNLNEIFSSLKVYDASKKKKFELKFYRNLENCLFLYEFPDKINVDTDFFVRFKVDFMDFGAIDDGYCLFAQIVNCLSVNN
uniref:Uncharacterized protein n=1 Tax=Panagrolaimus superbus TaxID=310955 RepID=A0A914Y825_9BILA